MTAKAFDTHIDVMHQPLLLVDFVRLYVVFFGQSEDAVLGRADVSPAQINPLCLLVLKRKTYKRNNANNETFFFKRILIT